MAYNILVFPCGSEVALEIHRSLKYSIHFNLFGANSIDDHGKFIFENYIGDLPFVQESSFLKKLKEVVEINKIDAIYPATDSTITILKENEIYLNCKVICSPLETTKICLSKSKTYQILSSSINVPFLYQSIDDIKNYPVFLKPDVGYGSRGVLKANSYTQVLDYFDKYQTGLILEYLPGKEYTVDCFTDNNGKLLFHGHRERKRIANGISVNTSTLLPEDRFAIVANKINEKINFTGAWFFQVKERANGEIVLMEIASRMGGSSGVYRMKGINFALLSCFLAFDIPVSIFTNTCEVEMDRALDCKFKLNINYNHVYIDFDDTLFIKRKINTSLIAFLYECINKNIKIYLITKHASDINEKLRKLRLDTLFDKIIHLEKNDDKYKYIEFDDSIFIDDSFQERKAIKDNKNIPVFDVSCF